MLASIGYAVEHLGVRLVMVLGHERCGAVSAAIAGGEAPGHLASLIGTLQPAMTAVRSTDGDRVDKVVRANALLVAQQIRTSQPLLVHAAETGELTVAAARYDLDTGQVEILSQPKGH